MPIIIDEFEQYSPEWYAACAGNVGASSLDKIITTTGARSKQREDFLLQLAGEKITGKQEETFQSLAMQKGKEREAGARALFEMLYNIEVKQCALVYKDEWKLCHCSPDGLIGEKKGIEIKNPTMKTHIKYLLQNTLPTEYLLQTQMSLYVTERESWYFMSAFEGLPPLIIEVQRNEKLIEIIGKEINEFNQELLLLVEKIKARQ